MTDSRLRQALLNKRGKSPQALYQMADRIKRDYGPMSTEDAIYWIAVDEGLDLSRFLDTETVDRVRHLRSALVKPPLAAARRGQAAVSAAAPPVAREALPTPAAMFNARNFHPMVVRRSRRLFVDGHNKDAVRAAFQSVNNRVKRLSGLSRDGQPLMAEAFREANPALQMTGLANQSEIDEHNGTRFMMMGAWTGMRNPRAHEDKWEPDNDVAAVLDALSFAGLLHRFLDRCEAYRKGARP